MSLLLLCAQFPSTPFSLPPSLYLSSSSSLSTPHLFYIFHPFLLPSALLPYPSPSSPLSPPLQLDTRRSPRPQPRPRELAGNPGDVTTRSALLPALSRKDAKVVTCPERQRGCAQSA